ncbi:NIPSNAP family protein [Amycolatopsis sp. NPDC089917]|uniref:NIPSNAP family protein n=1 Tax=Amycolatopsis sp. NPDC089917 TaxID=3155187 RepID=UPI0034383A38
MILEFRTYRLKPGSTADFLLVMGEESVPLLESAGLRVIDYGRSLVAEDGREEAYLIRAFTSLEEHERQEREFYGSEAWLKGPREAIVSRIESYHTIVIETSEAAAEAFRRA